MLYKSRIIISIIVLILTILGISAIFYPVSFLDIQFIPLLQRVLVDFSAMAVILLCILILFTLLFGRLYCSIICPWGIIQEIISLIRGKNKEKQRLNLPFKYFISFLTIGMMIGGSSVLIRYIDPYTLSGSFITLSLTGIFAAVFIILLTIFKNRYFCTNICPVGCILGLISKLSLFKIYINQSECVSCGKCERNCPSGCINSKEKFTDNEICIKCLKCTDICPKNAIKYGIKPKEEVKFSPKRRELIIATAALTVLIGAIKAGIETGKILGEKLRNVILPAGSDNAQRMLNKCLNCNLCVNACPNKIIVKANNDFNTVHIDYREGEKHCKYDCRECSRVCPSGAIEKITLEEKQKTRIAMAVINSDKCIKCAMCIKECPKNAITIEKNKTAIIDAQKCIGCGKCKLACKTDAIEIFAINAQQKV